MKWNIRSSLKILVVMNFALIQSIDSCIPQMYPHQNVFVFFANCFNSMTSILIIVYLEANDVFDRIIIETTIKKKLDIFQSCFTASSFAIVFLL